MVLRAIAVFPLLTNTACLPVLVGGLILKSSKSKADKREFITQLQNTTCVYDYYERLALGSHLFPGSSLHSNLTDQSFS